MTQLKIMDKELRSKPLLYKPYYKGLYNKYNNKEQWIRITEGCPNGCEFCRETFENGRDPIYYDIPKIEKNIVKIIDMNLIYKPKAIEIMDSLGLRKVNNKVVRYELLCGIDYRFLTQEISDCLHKNRFDNIRIAWDWSFGEQIKIKKAIDMLVRSGYKNKSIMVFMICNWKITFEENMRKLDLCKVWNVKVADCYFDNQTAPNIKPIHWTAAQIKDFRKKVRKHNQLVNFRIDPEERMG